MRTVCAWFWRSLFSPILPVWSRARKRDENRPLRNRRLKSPRIGRDAYGGLVSKCAA
jgi:hypothetical protein